MIFLQKLNFCYLVGYPHLKLASALSDHDDFYLPKPKLIVYDHVESIVEELNQSKNASLGQISTRVVKPANLLLLATEQTFTNVEESE